MDDTQLSAIFDQLYWGQRRSGWWHEDMGAAQLLISKDHIWARRVEEDGAAGVWVSLPHAS